MSDPHDLFPAGFFSRSDQLPDRAFYGYDRFVTHIDDRAIDAVGALYSELQLTGAVLDLCSSWVSHFAAAPAELVALGMNANELAANPMATSSVVHDLNVDPTLPFPDERFDAVTCCVSIDYLVRPIDVLRDAARVLRPGGRLVVTFSNRCFPTKAIRGWLETDDVGHGVIVSRFVELAGGFGPATVALRTPSRTYGDPLYGAWATRLS